MALRDPEQAALLEKMKRPKRGNKMHATGCSYRGIWFGSLGELGRYIELVWRAASRGGDVDGLEVHPVFRFSCGKKYIADFLYQKLRFGSTGWNLVVEDVKGRMLPMDKMHQALMRKEKGIEVQYVKPTKGHVTIARAALAKEATRVKELEAIFPFNPQKAIEVIGLLLRQQPKHQCSRVKLMVMLFRADREALAECGRPILGGHWLATKDGLVHKEVAALLRQGKSSRGKSRTGTARCK